MAEKKLVKLSTPRRIKTLETKEKIYTAAASIMKEYGYEYLSVKNICQTAGISNGTFFYHFKTKEDLMSFYLHERFEAYREAVGFDVADLPFDRKIIEYFKCYSSYVAESGVEFISSYYTAKNTALNTRKLRGGDNGDVLFAFTNSVMKQALEDKQVNPEQSYEVYTNNCCTIQKGIIFEWAITGGNLDMSLLLEQIMGAYLNSIKI